MRDRVGTLTSLPGGNWLEESGLGGWWRCPSEGVWRDVMIPAIASRNLIRPGFGTCFVCLSSSSSFLPLFIFIHFLASLIICLSIANPTPPTPTNRSALPCPTPSTPPQPLTNFFSAHSKPIFWGHISEEGRARKKGSPATTEILPECLRRRHAKEEDWEGGSWQEKAVGDEENRVRGRRGAIVIKDKRKSWCLSVLSPCCGFYPP